jgi:hypothetical protein
MPLPHSFIPQAVGDWLDDILVENRVALAGAVCISGAKMDIFECF